MPTLIEQIVAELSKPPFLAITAPDVDTTTHAASARTIFFIVAPQSSLAALVVVPEGVQLTEQQQRNIVGWRAYGAVVALVRTLDDARAALTKALDAQRAIRDFIACARVLEMLDASAKDLADVMPFHDLSVDRTELVDVIRRHTHPLLQRARAVLAAEGRALGSA